jgi:hypothetical protein
MDTVQTQRPGGCLKADIGAQSRNPADRMLQFIPLYWRGRVAGFQPVRLQEKTPKSGGSHLFGGGNGEPKMSYDRGSSREQRELLRRKQGSEHVGGGGKSFFGGAKAPKSSGEKGGHSGGHSSGHSGHHHH